MIDMLVKPRPNAPSSRSTSTPTGSQKSAQSSAQASTSARPAPPLPPLAAPLLSPLWFRLARLRPQLQAQVGHERMVLRGRIWQTLVAADGRRSFRLNAAAWAAVARCDGQHTVHQLWQAALAEHADDAPTQHELLQMLSQLHSAGLLSFDRAPDFCDVAAATGPHGNSAPPATGADAQRRQHLLAWRVSLGNPDALLARLAGGPRTRGAWPHNPWTSACIAAWLLLLAWAAGAALMHASELANALGPLMATPASWAWAWLIYPLLKLLHEGAHGLVARRCGAVVADWGVTWLMFVPVPYVDASAASALPRRRQRLAVSAAGIAVELSVAALACALLLNVQAGAVHDAALLVFYLTLGSSLLVNANPLLRFDGYHMLCDAFGLPNLASRSTQHWLQLARRHLLRLPPAQAPAAAAGEAPWLWAYAPAALLMRWLVAGAVVLWLGGWSQQLGLLGLAVFAWTLVLAPLARLCMWLQHGGWQQLLRAGLRGSFVAASAGAGTSTPFNGRRAGLLANSSRAGLLARVRPLAAPAVLALPAGLLCAVLLWPLPVGSVAQGVLWLPETALVRAEATGFVAEVLVADGLPVQAGDAVLRLHAPALQAEAERLHGRVQDLQAEQERALLVDAAAAATAGHALQAAQAELAQAQARQQRLTVRVQAAGRLAINHAADLSGRYVERGTLLAHVVTGDPGIIKLAMAQEHAAQLPALATTVQVLAAGDEHVPRTGRWMGAATGAHAQLPSAALGSRSGGRFSVDPADRSGLRPAQAVVLGEVQLQGAAASHLGQRVLVRFDHGHAPLLLQAARAGQQLLLRHFNPAP